MNEKPIRIAIGGAQRTAARPCLVAAVLSVLAGLPVTTARAATAPSEARAGLAQARWGDPTTVRLPDGVRVSGEFRALYGSWEDVEGYANRYEDWRAAQPALLSPRLGAALTLVTASGDTLRGPLAGVEPAFVVLGTANPQVHTGAFTARVVSARIDSTELDSTAWREHVAAWGTAPALDAVALQGPGALWVVPADNVAGASFEGIDRNTKSNDNPAVTLALLAVGIGVGYLLLTTMVESIAHDIRESFDP